MSTVKTIPLYANNARIYYSIDFCIGHNKRKNYLYKRSYMTSCTFISIKYTIIHQSLTDSDKTVREETCFVWDLKCEIWVSHKGVSKDAGHLGSDTVLPDKLFPHSEGSKCLYLQRVTRSETSGLLQMNHCGCMKHGNHSTDNKSYIPDNQNHEETDFI
jgi:hypothetical protein